MTMPDLSAEMFGWLRDVLFLLAATVLALCGVAVVAICSLCVEACGQVRAVVAPRRDRATDTAAPLRAWTRFVGSVAGSETPAGPSAQ